MDKAAVTPDRPGGIAEPLGILRRRWRLFTGVTAAVLAAFVVLALVLPPVYRASATILIEQQEIPPDLVRSTVAPYADQRLQVISQRVMTSANLLEIIRRYDLYPEERRRQPREVLLETIRDDIGLEVLSADVVDPRSGRLTQATIAFTLSFDYPDPTLAYRVTNELTSLYLEENVHTRTQLVLDTSAFLEREATKLSAQIAELEEKLAAFKEENVERLPELMQLNLRLVDRTERELLDAERDLRSLDERKVYLQTVLAQLEPDEYADKMEEILDPRERLRVLKANLVSRSAVYAADHPDLVRLRREIEGLQAETGDTDGSWLLRAELATARAELNAARQRYGPDHPDLARLARQVSDLEGALAAGAPAGGTAPASDYEVDLGAGGNSTYITLSAQLQAIEAQRAALEEQTAELREKLAGYEARIAGTPQIESEYRALARGYDNARAKYQEVKAKQMEAQIAQALEVDRKAERFAVIDPALAPEEPIRPNRWGIIFLGLVLSIAGGIVALTVIEQLDQSVRSYAEVTELVGVAPLAAVPVIATLGDAATRGRRRWMMAGGATAAVFLAAVLVHWRVAPLDTLWFVTMRRLGL